MSQKLFNSLFAISMVTIINVFPAAPVHAIGADIGSVERGECAASDAVWLGSGEAYEADALGGVEVHLNDDGFLLAEAYSSHPDGEPQVQIQGAETGGADWLSGRLVPVRAGSYCITVSGQSPRSPWRDSRLVLAFADPSQATGWNKNGDPPADPNTDGGDGTEAPEDPMEEVLLAFEGVLADATSTRVPFSQIQRARSDGQLSSEETGNEAPEDPMEEVLLTHGRSGGVDSEEMSKTAFMMKNGTGESGTGETGEEAPEDPMEEVLLTGEVESPSPSAAALAQKLGLCRSSAMAGTLACAADLAIDTIVSADFAAQSAKSDVYTFEIKERSTLSLQWQGEDSWVALYDINGNLVDLSADGTDELIRHLNAGRYMVRVGSDSPEGRYSLTMAQLAR